MSDIKIKKSSDENKINNTSSLKKNVTTVENSSIVSNLMKKGDYTVHILIEEIKNICSKKENDLPQPCIKLTCLGKTKRTTKPNNVESYTFNEHFYFEKTDLSTEYLESAKILIEAYDYHHTNKNDYFGIQEFDFEYVYSM